jgi:putative selenate reductase
MSDRMKPIAFEDLIEHIFTEYRNEKTVFGIRKFFKADSSAALPLFGEKIEMPFGPAAGPHTQLAQNIISAYLCGGRFFELKTVQKLDGDDLKVAKPCITAADEGYNCEWSTELSVPQAYAEYVKAWIILKILAAEFDLGSPDGFVFNMSVGYDLEGIKTPKIDSYIEGMKNASENQVFTGCIQTAARFAARGRFKNVTEQDIKGISPRISSSITLSTLHGCPPQEIERIARYLIKEKRLHTFVKCNPTLLGYDFARSTLDGLGFDYVAFDDHHFKEDLQYTDAVPMFRRLQAESDATGVVFGVKLTNTCPVDVDNGQLPSEEMYMSGRSLAPLTLALAAKLSRTFDGKLRISYSGGAGYENIDSIVGCGIWPVTLATSLLKPGGYHRLHQIAGKFTTGQTAVFSGVDVEKITDLAARAGNPETGSRKSIKLHPVVKLRRKLPLTDCFIAPCSETCPIHQDIPAYVRLAGAGNYDESLRVITDKNPLPFITGTICPHTCMGRCTRNFYDTSVQIRETKLAAAQHAYSVILQELQQKKSAAQKAAGGKTNGKRVAVIGGGPAGLSAAFFLAREGISVTVFEKEKKCGGIVGQVIPSFRISGDAVEKDVALVRAAGAELVTGKEIRNINPLFSEGYTDILIAVGAWEPAGLRLSGDRAVDALDFLRDCRTGATRKYGSDIVVIGAGNTAMDVARAALRIPDIKTVRLVYRRTRRYMPADEDELECAMQEGVDLKELRSPVSYRNGRLVCSVMKLGDFDASGRRRPVDTGTTEEISCTAVIAATGENVPSEVYRELGIKLDERNMPVLNNRRETSVPHVYVAGDAAGGPATVVEAIAGAAAFAAAITEIHNRNYEQLNTDSDIRRAAEKKGVVDVTTAAGKTSVQSGRCLECSVVCENCVDVCPNRANVAVTVPGDDGTSSVQIVHLDDLCNECGNCAVFCPYDGRPYKDKFTLFRTAAAMDESTNYGFAPMDRIGDSGERLFRIRVPGFDRGNVDLNNLPAEIDRQLAALITTVVDRYSYL